MRALDTICRSRPLLWSFSATMNPGHACTLKMPIRMNSEPRIPFPEDLREWVEESILVEVLPKSASALSSNLVAASEQPPSCESLLRVLGFSYATGRYYSEDIEESCYRVAALKTLCDGEKIPKASELRAFRRSHHLQLHDLLCRVIGTASAQSLLTTELLLI